MAKECGEGFFFGQTTNECADSGHDANYLSQLKTGVGDKDGVEIIGCFVDCDYLVSSVDGEQVCRNPIGFPSVRASPGLG